MCVILPLSIERSFLMCSRPSDIASAVQSDLLPTVEKVGLAAYAKFETACSIEASDFDPPAEGYSLEMVFKKYR